MSKPNTAPRGLVYQPGFLNTREREGMLGELAKLHPIWEQRYSEHNPPPEGQSQRWLLRPVYWLGNWQFACLNYYHPPKGLEFRCVEAEPFPPVMQMVVDRVTQVIRAQIAAADIPKFWELNTCLVNYYGSHEIDGKKNDVARVGEHKDFEPGPVASISFGDKALFQFVSSKHKNAPSQVVYQQWLEDSALQVFAGDRFKKQLFHRVQRVEDKRKEKFSNPWPNYETRRLNLTFRYVPRDHVQPLHRFPKTLQQDVKPWVQALAPHSVFFAKVFEQVYSSEN